jgi:hypothetical protein
VFFRGIVILIVGLVVFGSVVIIFRFWQYEPHPPQVRYVIENLWYAFEEYSSDNPDGKYPPFAPFEDLTIFDPSVLYQNPNLHRSLPSLVSPELPNRRELEIELRQMMESKKFDWERVAEIAAQSYIYFGWDLRNAEDLHFMEAAKSGMSDEDYDEDILVDGHEPIRRLHKSLYADSGVRKRPPGVDDIPVLFERPVSPNARGIHVLYMGGQVWYHKKGDPKDDPNGIVQVLLREWLPAVGNRGHP